MKRAFRTSIALVLAGLFAGVSAHGQTMGDYNEAPMLAEMVEAGTLPPVAERVSEEPLVRDVLGEIGQYGGTLRRWGPDPVGGWIQLNYYRGLGDAGGFGFIIPYDLAGYMNDGLHFGGLDPLYATEYQFSDDFTELTVWHRRGIKWSDGHPLTSDDIIWSMEEVGNDVNIHPNGTWWSHSGGEPIKVEKIDDYTVKYISAVPNPDLTLYVSGPWALYPKHYAEQFHPKFNSDSTYEAFKNNTELRFLDDPGSMPQIGPWVVTQLDSVDGAFATRNPYYPVVDTAGNQLPYIDNIHIRILADQQVAALAVIQGQIDVQGRGMQGFQNYQVMKEGEAEGDYQVLNWKGGAFQGYLKLFFQLNDENLAKMMYEVDFRRALSLAINRDEINEALYFGLAQPSGTMVGQDSPFYDSRMEAYGRYDPDEAKRIFAELGLKDTDGDGILQYPDGQNVTIIIDTPTDRFVNTPQTELVVRQWRDVGIDAILNAVKRSVIFEKMRAYDAQVVMHWGPSLQVSLPWVFRSGGYNPDSQTLGTKYENPPPEFLAAWELEQELISATDPETFSALTKELWIREAEEVTSWIAITSDFPVVIIRHNRIGNLPDVATAQKMEYSAYPDQFYIKYEVQ